MVELPPSRQQDSGAQGESLLAKSKVVCMAPWVHVHLSSLGDFTPCCEIFEPLGKSEGATLASHWNGKAMADLRTAMLQDAPQRMCRKCYEKDEAGLHSPRRQFNEIHRDRQVRENFEIFRHVVFDFNGDYYAAIPLIAPYSVDRRRPNAMDA